MSSRSTRWALLYENLVQQHMIYVLRFSQLLRQRLQGQLSLYTRVTQFILNPRFLIWHTFIALSVFDFFLQDRDAIRTTPHSPCPPLCPVIPPASDISLPLLTSLGYLLCFHDGGQLCPIAASSSDRGTSTCQRRFSWLPLIWMMGLHFLILQFIPSEKQVPLGFMSTVTLQLRANSNC